MRTSPEPGARLLIDGGTGTELRRRGVRLDPVVWSARAALDAPRMLTRIHADFLEAGADVIMTNTFGAARFVLEAAGLGSAFDAISRASVDAARRAREQVGRDAAIAGSISCLPPSFDAARYPPPAVERAAYVELATKLAELGVDLLVLEMMEDIEHARRACDAVQSVGLPFWIGVSARRTADGTVAAYDFPTTPLDAVLDVLLGAQPAPAVVNVMHTPLDDVAAALATVRRRWNGPIGAYPEISESTGAGSTTPAALAERADAWLRAGAQVLGGCCGTGPEHVRALRALLDRHASGLGSLVGDGREG